MQQATGIGFPSRKPFGYPNASYYRIQVREDVKHTDGHVKVGKGAKGVVVANDRGYLVVLFDEGQDCHIDLSGCGNLIQEVPSLVADRIQ